MDAIFAQIAKETIKFDADDDVVSFSAAITDYGLGLLMTVFRNGGSGMSRYTQSPRRTSTS